MKSNIVLIGMSAAGKSTLGVIVAKRLGLDFLDTDLLIQKSENSLLSEIIEKKGLDKFLEIENNINKGINVKNTVIAPGGSVVYCEEAMEHLKKDGLIVYLEVPYDVLRKRIKSTKSRGMVIRKDQTLKDIYDERKVLFEKYAEIVIKEKGKRIEDNIDILLDSLKGKINHLV